jgi:hypothetical protein
MNLQEIRDNFNARYKLETIKRGTAYIDLGDKMIAFFISEAQQDIQRRLAVVHTSYELTLTGAETYDLPSNFGNDITVTSGTAILTKKPYRWLRENFDVGNSGDYYSIDVAGNTQKILVAGNSGTVIIYYYPDFNYYRPSLSSVQDWGTFSGVAYSGKILLPDRYSNAIILKMLSNIANDYLMLYEKELKSLRESRVGSVEETINYSFAGVDETVSTTSVPVGSSVPTPSSGSSTADKVIRVRVSDAGTYTTPEEDGWSSTPTIVNNVSSVVITSPSSEFNNYIHVRVNQNTWTWEQTGATTITLYPDSSSGWGEAEIIIEIWD